MEKHNILLIGLISVAVGAGGFYLSRQKTEKAALAVSETPLVMELSPSEMFLVRRTDLKQAVPMSGSLRPVHQVSLKSEVSARLSDVLVREGGPVKKGDVIAQFDLEELASRLKEREGNLQAAKAQLDFAQRNLARKEQLQGKGYASQVAEDEAENNYQQALSSVRATQAQYDIAKEAMGKATVYAPLSGFVGERLINPGEKLSVDGKMVTIVDLSEMEIEAAIPSSDIAEVGVGQMVEFRVQGLKDKSFTGRVERINPTTKTGSRSIPVYISVENKGELLRGGMFATGEIIVKMQPQVLAAPSGAIRGDGEDRYALTVVNGQITRRSVEAELTIGDLDLVAITQGLDVGDTVISAPAIQLADGTRVRVSTR